MLEPSGAAWIEYLRTKEGHAPAQGVAWRQCAGAAVFGYGHRLSSLFRAPSVAH